MHIPLCDWRSWSNNDLKNGGPYDYVWPGQFDCRLFLASTYMGAQHLAIEF
jgi:hypothetical protein